jgi:hypothetical protein
MPLDNVFDSDGFKRRCIGWELKFSLLPRRCFYSKKLLWMRLAYKGTSMITGPGEPLFEYRWVSKKEFLLQRIKGSI